jgi:3-dehydroquinate dehydratase
MSSNLSILLINGPNLNLLGTREPAIYGADTLPDVVARAKVAAEKEGAVFADFQSNHEGAIIDRIHQARLEGVDGIVINPGQFILRRAGDGILTVNVFVRRVHAHVGRDQRCPCWNINPFH